jgi:ABC-2 type transport system permease protein
MRVLSTLHYLVALARCNVAAGLGRPFLAIWMAAMMFANNLIMFLIWAIYFGNFSSIRGWGLEDMALLIGIVAWAFGLTVFLAEGAVYLADVIVDGGLDLHLGRPRHPLPSLIMSRSAPSGLGDLASALVFWFWLGGRSLGDLPLLILVASAAAVILVATTVITQSLAFWWPRALPLCDQIFDTFIMVAYYPQHPYGFTVRLALFTVFPTAYVALVPTLIMRAPDVLMLLGLLAAAAVYAGLAALVFDRGLRRYASGNRILELR